MPNKQNQFTISEDWWAVIVAFILILFAAVGLLGKGGLPIVF
jgi:hypothetical protein